MDLIFEELEYLYVYRIITLSANMNIIYSNSSPIRYRMHEPKNIKICFNQKRSKKY